VSTVMHRPDNNMQAAPASTVDTAMAEALGLAGNRPPESLALLRENVRLQCLYPNEYVAYIDYWTADGDRRTLLRRVVAHSPSLPELFKVIATLPSQDRAAVILDYATDLDQELLDGHDEFAHGNG
jgi:hypothetical protein